MARRESKEIGSAGGSSSLSSEPSAESEASAAAAADRKKKKKKESALDEMLKRRSAKIREAKEKAEKDTAAASVAAAAAAADSPTAKRRSFLFRSTSYSVRSSTGSASSSPTSSPPSSSPPSISFFGTLRNRRSRGEEEVVRHHSGDGFQIAQEREKERERMALMMGYSSSDTSVATTAASGGTAQSENESDKERSDSETETTMRIRAASVYGSGEHAAVAAAAALVPQKSKEKRKKRTASTRIQRVKEGPSKWLQRTSSLTNIKPEEGQAPAEGKEKEKDKEKGEKAKEEVKTIVVLEVAEEAHAQTSNGKKEKEKKNKKEKKERKQEKRKKKEKSRQAMDAIPRSESEDGLAVGRAGKAKAQAEEVSPPTNTEQPAAAPHKAESTEEAGSVQPPPSVTAQPPPEPKSETELKPELERASTEPEPAPAPTAAVETPSAAEGEKDDERMRELTALAKAVTKAVASSVKDAVVESSRPRPIQQHQRSNTETSLAIINQFATQASLPASGGPLSPRKRSGRSANAKDRKRRGTSALLLNTIASATPATATTASPTPHECKGAAPSAKMTELFALAEQQVEKFFTQMTYSSKLGFVKILDDRYLLLRSSSLHVELLNAVTNTFGLSAAAAAAITPAATTAAAAGGAASGSMLSISCPPVGVDTTSPASPPTSRPPLQRNSSERSVPTGTANSWQRQTTSESANSFSSISNLWKRLSSSLETPTKEIVAHDEAERKAKAAKGRGLIEPFTPETASGGAASAGPTPETASSGGAGKRARRERDRAADDSSTVDAYGFLPRQLSTSGTNVPLLTPRRKLISDEAEKMRIGRSATVTAYDSSSLFASAASLSSGSAVSLSSSLSSASSLPSATRPYYASLPPALRQKRDFERKFVYTFARSLGRKDAQLFSKRAGFIAVMQQTLLGSNAAGGSALVAATSASLSSSPSSSATLSAAGGLPVMNAAQAGLSPPWKRGRGSMIILPSSNEASSAIIPSGVGRDTEISIASGFLQLSFMGWSFVKVFPQSLLSRKINFRSAVAAAGGEKSSTHSKPDGADEPGRSVPRPVPGGSGLAQQQHNSGKKASTGETTTATGTGATGRAASDDSSKEKEINFYFLCDFNNSFEIQDSTAAAAATATALASMSATSSASSSTSGASQLAASATATATAAGKEKQEKQEKERKKKQRRRGSFILHSAKKKSLEEEEEREERDMRTAGPCCLINAGYISGWCETCLGLDVLAVEVLCRANGDECCRFLIAPPQMMKRHLLTFFSENNFDDRRRREVLEREGVLWSREWREKNAQEKKSSGGSGSSDAVPTMSTVLSGELLGPSTSSAAVGGGDESQRSAHSTTTTTAWRNKRLSVSLTLNTTKVDADENDDEFSLLKKFKDEDQRIEANARHGAEEAGEEGEPGEPGGEEQRQRLSGEKRVRAKLVRLEEMCVSRYRNVFHHMKGDVRKGIITLSEKPSYARRRKSRKSASERYVLLRAEGLAVTLRQSVESLFPRGTAQPEVKTFVDNFLYDFGQCLGRSDCAHLESRVLRPTAPNTSSSSSSTSTSSSLTSSTSSLIVSGVLHAERVQARLALLERLFGLSAVLSSTGWGLVNFAFSTDFLRSLGGREEKEKEKAKAKTMEPVESESGDSASMPIPSPSSSSSSSSSPASSFYLKISVAQSVEAVEFLSKHAHKNESEGEGENESESEESSNPQANGKRRRGPAPACLVLSGYIDGYIKHTVGSCPSARGAPLHLVPEDLVTVEVACKSQGAECCEFVTAHIDHIADVIKREAASATVTTLDDGTTTTGVVGLLKIVRGRHKSGRGWLAHCLETSSSSSSSAATPIKK